MKQSHKRLPQTYHTQKISQYDACSLTEEFFASREKIQQQIGKGNRTTQNDKDERIKLELHIHRHVLW